MAGPIEVDADGVATGAMLLRTSGLMRTFSPCASRERSGQALATADGATLLAVGADNAVHALTGNRSAGRWVCVRGRSGFTRAACLRFLTLCSFVLLTNKITGRAADLILISALVTKASIRTVVSRRG